MLNKYHWELFRKYDGEETIRVFNNFIEGKSLQAFVVKLFELHEKYCPDASLSKSFRESIFAACDYLTTEINKSGKSLFCEPEAYADINTDELSSIDEILQFIWEDCLEENGGNEKNAFSVLAYDIAYLSIYLSIYLAFECPALFIPYGYQCLHNVLEEICQDFDLSLPAAWHAQMVPAISKSGTAVLLRWYRFK